MHAFFCDEHWLVLWHFHKRTHENEVKPYDKEKVFIEIVQICESEHEFTQ